MGRKPNLGSKKSLTSLGGNGTVPAVGPPQKKTRQELEEENASLRRLLEASRMPAEGVISKPKGQAGRGNGYNLYDEMCLSSSATYNVIRNVVRVIGTAYLDLRLTWTQQDTKAKDRARQEVKKLVPIMKYYYHGWPIDAFLKQYLGSSAAKYRKDMQMVNAIDEVPSLEKVAASKGVEQDVEDFVSFASDESESESEDGCGVETGDKGTKTSTKGKDATNAVQATEQLHKARGNAKSKASHNEPVEPSNIIEGAQKPARQSKKGSNSKKRQLPLTDNTEEVENRPPKRTCRGKKDVDVTTKPQDSRAEKQQLNNGPESSRPARQTRGKKVNETAATDPDRPSVCPDKSCEEGHVFPPSPSKRLATAYRNYLAQKSTFNAFLVCVQIHNDQKLPDLRQVAIKNKWPIQIDFGSLADRIGNHRDEISGLFTNEIVISLSAAWKTVIRTLANSSIPLSKFNGLADASKFSILNPVSHAGYYGPRGIEIIRATIYSTLLGKDQLTITGELQATLADVFENHRDSTIAFAGFWDLANGHSISLTNFIEFVVTPHIANLLIEKDLIVSEDTANGHRLRSKDVGDAFQHGTDNDEDSVEHGPLPGHFRRIAQQPSTADSGSVANIVSEPPNPSSALVVPTVKIPPRPRPTRGRKATRGGTKSTGRAKSTGGTKSTAPKDLTMSDFPPPVVK